MGVIFGLIAAFCWGLGDYLITALTRRVGTAQALVYIQLLSLLTWVCLLLSHPMLPGVGVNIWALALAAGVCHVLGLLLSYRAFEIGTLSLVSPIASGFAVVTAVLAISSGEHPPAIALGGATLLFVGIILATRAPGHAEESSPEAGAPEQALSPKATLAGVPEALGCALAFGVMFWMMKGVETNIGTDWSLIVLKAMASGYALGSFTFSQLKARQTSTSAVEPALTVPPADSLAEAPADAKASTTWLLAISVAVVDTSAWLAYNAGIRTAYTSIVTALASLFSVITILLAWLLLKERLATNQWGGIAIILFGVLLVSIQST